MKSGDRPVPSQATWIVTGPLLTGARPSDRLGHEQRPRGWAIGVSEVRGPTPTRRDRHGVRATDHDCRDGAGGAVHRLCDHATSRRGDGRVDMRVIADGPGRDHKVGGQSGAVADRMDHNHPLMPGKRTRDRLRHLQLAGDEPVGVADIRLDDVTGRDRHRLPTALDVDRHRTRVPINGLGDRARRRNPDGIVLPGLIPRRSPGRDHKVRCQGGGVAHRVDPDLPFPPRTRTGDRLSHDQRADMGVGIGDLDRLMLARRDRHVLPVPGHHHLRADCAAVRGLDDSALRSNRDRLIRLRRGARGRAGGNDEVGLEGAVNLPGVMTLDTSWSHGARPRA